MTPATPIHGPGLQLSPCVIVLTGPTHAKLVSLTSPCCSGWPCPMNTLKVGVFSSWLASRDLGTTRSSYLAWVGPVIVLIACSSTPVCNRHRATRCLGPSSAAQCPSALGVCCRSPPALCPLATTAITAVVIQAPLLPSSTEVIMPYTCPEDVVDLPVLFYNPPYHHKIYWL